MDPGAFEAVDDRLTSTLDDLLGQASLDPGIVVDALFNRLVTAILSVPEPAADAVLAALPPSHHPAVFRSVASTGEHALERSWADRIVHSSDPVGTFAHFPYRENYRLLVEMELEAVRREGTEARHVLLLGSGPLPLTALCLAEHGITVHCVDHDAEAIRLSSAAFGRLGAVGVTFEHADAAAATPPRPVDVVLLAGLVGVDDAAKAAVLGGAVTHLAPGGLVLARSARGLRTLLYPPVGPAAFAGLRVVAEAIPEIDAPGTDVINSAILARPSA
ncbi:nicotianamine synthase [Nocardioides albertanoniae]|uniref:Nicotianamine synthase n=1 Tax=Nocardioides albertanoniae TaxID=1175486 RepID=A0A543A1G6_9ACTN|nr:nicotianamine synthase family protein [Nocardioides albertanoniae]TQL66428.1 nicotianamine synthase [Nocardioides albertanoniae]